MSFEKQDHAIRHAFSLKYQLNPVKMEQAHLPFGLLVKKTRSLHRLEKEIPEP